MIYYDLNSFHIPLGREDMPKLCLGKKFASNIRTRDAGYINHLRSKVEELKLKIIDSAEAGDRPPTLEGTRWLYDLRYNNQDFNFIYREFEDWLYLNGLEGKFYGCNGDINLKIMISNTIDIGKSPKENTDTITVSLTDLIKPKRNNP